MKRRRQTRQDFLRFESHSAKDILRDAFMSGSQADISIAVYFSQKNPHCPLKSHSSWL